MHGDFEPLEEYNGDIIRIDRLIEFLPTEHWSWDETGEINLNDISIAIHEAIPEISNPYGDTWKHPVLEQKSREWHIGRIIYFINHPIEIKDIEIDNECSDNFILPQDGYMIRANYLKSIADMAEEKICYCISKAKQMNF